jgi:hypothetical protein
MNPSGSEPVRLTAWSVAILGTFCIMAGLVWALYHFTRPEDLAAKRALERRQFLREVKDAEATLTSTYAWQDQAKGIVRLPVQRALELVLQEWQNPSAARSNLIARVETATAPPPKAPEKPNPYE